MRKTLVFFGVFLCLSLPAAAQEIATAFDTGNLQELNRQPHHPPPLPWFISNLRIARNGSSDLAFSMSTLMLLRWAFSDLGYNASITRYFDNWFGLEGTAVMGWGHTSTSPNVPRALDAKSFFVGGGPHLALSNRSRFEPWGHVVVGLAHFRFTQTNNTLGLGSNSALGFLAGGGVDVKLGGRAYWRIQGDYVETHFQSMIRKTTTHSSQLTGPSTPNTIRNK